MNVLVEEQNLQDIADAIREVTSTEDKFKPSEMGNAQRNFARGLIATANATTGKTDTDLTSAVGSLVSGYGQGGGSGDIQQFIDYIEGNEPDLVIPQGVKVIRDYAFINSHIKSVRFNDSIETIGGFAFRSNSKLKNVYDFPQRVTNLSQYLFDGSGLEKVDFLPEGLLIIQRNVFSSCPLTEVTLPNSLTTLLFNVFLSCSYLTKITIPPNMSSMRSGSMCIGSATNKATITMLPTTPPSIETNTFDTTKLEKIIVPAGYGEVYASATNWSDLAEYIEEASE